MMSTSVPCPDPGSKAEGESSESCKMEDVPFKFYLRDTSEDMVSAWENKEGFGTDKFKDLVEV